MKTFRRLLACHLIIVALATGILGTLLYSFFSTDATSDLITIGNSLVSQLNSTSDTMFEEVTAVATGFLANPNILAQISMTSQSHVREYQATLSLKQQQTAYPFINYIGLHNVSQNTCTSLKWGVSDKKDQDIMELLKSDSQVKGVRIMPRTIISAAGKPERVLSFIYPVPLINTKNCYGAISINIDMDYLEDILRSYGDTQGTSIQIFNSSGDLLAEYNNDGPDCIEFIDALTQLDSSGLVTRKIKNEKVYVFYSRENALDWVIVRSQASQMMFNKLSLLRRNTILAAMIIAAIGGLIAAVSLSRIYRPIQRAMKYVHPVDKTSGEFQQLEHALQTASNLSASLETTISDTIDTLEEAYVHSLLLGHDVTAFTSLSLFSDIIERLKDWMLVIYLELDDIHDQSLLSDLCQSVKGNLSEIGHCVALMDGNNVTMLLCTDSQIENSIITRVLEEIITEGKFTFSAGIAEWTDDPESLSYYRALAIDRLKYRRLINTPIIDGNVIDMLPKKQLSYPRNLEKQLISTIQEGDHKKWETLVDSFVESLRDSSYTYAILNINQLLISIIKMCPPGKEPADELLDGHFSLPRYVRTPEQLKRYLLQRINLIIEALDENELYTHSQLVGSMKEYIVEHYSDINLSVDAVSESVKMSSGYCSRLFKAETGQSIGAFILEVRMNRAEEMLKNTSMSISEICTAVGIPNATYFATVFKKHYRTTPSQYRRI